VKLTSVLSVVQNNANYGSFDSAHRLYYFFLSAFVFSADSEQGCQVADRETFSIKIGNDDFFWL